MKKLFLIALMIIGIAITANAQVQRYRSTAFACKTINAYGTWNDWTDWQSSNLLITIDLTNDVVKIYSQVTQTYYITEYLRNFTDNSGGKQIEFKFIDQDQDRGHMRLRVETNGNSQIYIEFANCMWVYNVVRTR